MAGELRKSAEGIVASNPHLTLFAHPAQKSGKPDRRIDIARCHAVVGVFHHVTPDQLVLRLQG